MRGFLHATRPIEYVVDPQHRRGPADLTVEIDTPVAPPVAVGAQHDVVQVLVLQDVARVLDVGVQVRRGRGQVSSFPDSGQRDRIRVVAVPLGGDAPAAGTTSRRASPRAPVRRSHRPAQQVPAPTVRPPHSHSTSTSTISLGRRGHRGRAGVSQAHPLAAIGPVHRRATVPHHEPFGVGVTPSASPRPGSMSVRTACPDDGQLARCSHGGTRCWS